MAILYKDLMPQPAANLINVDQITKELYKKNLELYKQSKRVEQLLYRVSEAIFAVDETFSITLFNHTLEQLLGKLSNDVMGKPVSEVINLTEEDGKVINIKELCTQTVQKLPNLAILPSVLGDRYVHIKLSLIETSHELKEHLFTLTDITKEKQLEKAKDEFLSIASHELRTPMSIVKSYLWMITTGKDGALTDKQKDHADKALKGTERMITLINDMLNISRLEQGKIEFKLQHIDLHQFLLELIDELSIKAKENNIYLKLEPAPTIKYVYGDKQALREIVTNLVGNSFKFTKTGGITIKTEKLDDLTVKISICDTGKGIKQEDLKLLFNKFQRLDSSYQNVASAGGTGLGLYIVKLYVSKLGGTVGVHSDGEDKGSTFWFTARLVPEEPEEIRSLTT